MQFASISTLTLDAVQSHQRLQKVRPMLLCDSLYNLGFFPALMDVFVQLLCTGKQVKQKHEPFNVFLCFLQCCSHAYQALLCQMNVIKMSGLSA